MDILKLPYFVLQLNKYPKLVSSGYLILDGYFETPILPLLSTESRPRKNIYLLLTITCSNFHVMKHFCLLIFCEGLFYSQLAEDAHLGKHPFHVTMTDKVSFSKEQVHSALTSLAHNPAPRGIFTKFVVFKNKKVALRVWSHEIKSLNEKVHQFY